MNPSLHELEEAKARVSLEVSAFRRELDILRSDKEEFLKRREEEALALVARDMDASASLLSEAKDCSESVDQYLKSLVVGRNELKEAVASFKAWKDREEESLRSIGENVEKSVSEMKKKAQDFALQKIQLEGAKRDMELASEQARKDFEKVQKEREKLAKNKDYIAFLKKNYGRRKEGSEPRDDASVR